MRFTLTMAGVALLAGCSTPPPLSPVQARRVVTEAMMPCDAAVGRLAERYAAAPVGAQYDAASEVDSACPKAQVDMGAVALPAEIYGPCDAAAQAAIRMGDAARDALDTDSLEAAWQYRNAVEAQISQRELCKSRLETTAETSRNRA